MKNHGKITKAVIAAAGYGTRFLPATKNQPKEMLPIIDKPIIQYLVEEAVEAGITEIILVTRNGQHIMEDYFDNNRELENSLEKAGKLKRLELIRNIPQMANFVYVRQRDHLPYGNGTPLLAVQNLIDDNEKFVYMMGDDLTISHTEHNITQQLMNVFQQQNPTAAIAVQKVNPSEVNRYGIVKYKENADYEFEVETMVEKPDTDKAPSNMAILGRYILSYDVVEQAQQTPTGKDNELWLADMLKELAGNNHKLIAEPIKGEWVTTGDPLNYLKATIKFALQRDDLKNTFAEFLKNEIC